MIRLQVSSECYTFILEISIHQLTLVAPSEINDFNSSETFLKNTNHIWISLHVLTGRYTFCLKLVHLTLHWRIHARLLMLIHLKHSWKNWEHVLFGGMWLHRVKHVFAWNLSTSPCTGGFIRDLSWEFPSSFSKKFIEHKVTHQVTSECYTFLFETRMPQHAFAAPSNITDVNSSAAFLKIQNMYDQTPRDFRE